MRWHNKPPVNGRELTAEDVKYTYERFLTIKGNANRPHARDVDKIEALDKHTVQVHAQGAVRLVPRPARLHLDLDRRQGVRREVRRSQEAGGRGRHRALDARALRARHAASSFVRNPNYFVPGLPYADGVEVTHRHRSRLRRSPPSSPASTTSARSTAWWCAGATSTSPSSASPGPADARTTSWCSAASPWMKLDQEPFKDVRVRRALAHGQQLARGARDQCVVAGPGRAEPARSRPRSRSGRSRSTSSPPEGRQLYEHDTAGAKRLLAEAGHPNGFKTPVETTARLRARLHGRGPDRAQELEGGRHRRRAEAQGVRRLHLEHDLRQVRQDDGSALRGGCTDPDSYFYRYYLPGQPLNAAGVNDPKLTEMIKLQRRTFDVAKRREIVYDIQRYVSQQAYYGYGASVSAVGGLGALREELRPEHRPRLRRPPHGRLARQVAPGRRRRLA